MSVVPKTMDGEPITDFEAEIIYEDVNGSKNELKEWYAVVKYLESFDKVNGVPQVTSDYQETQGRKIVDNNKNIIALVSHPNKISLTVYIVVPVIIFLIAFVIVKLIRYRRKKESIASFKKAA
jgi:hypothetical protein